MGISIALAVAVGAAIGAVIHNVAMGSLSEQPSGSQPARLLSFKARR